MARASSDEGKKRTRRTSSRPGRQSERQRGQEAREEERVAADRKERILHTRISSRLAEDISRAADDLRVPVSNLVRNVLEDVFTVVGSVTDNVSDLIDDVMGEAEHIRERLDQTRQRTHTRERRARAPRGGHRRAGRRRPIDPSSFPDVIGWQPLILNHEQHCSACAAEIGCGDRAVVGLGSGGPTEVYLCRNCMADGS